jgi:ABC-type transport system involved in multi-copper enzyme maturation permease subunit
MTAKIKMLLWKDFRLSRICLLAGMVFLCLPYLLCAFTQVFFKQSMNFDNAWAGSLLTSQLTMVFLAGNIIACERADRSAAFLAYQGARRKMVIGSKLLLCMAMFVLNFVIAVVLSFWLPSTMNESTCSVYTFIAPIGLCFFGCCWLLSSLLSSPAAAIVLGFITPFFIGCSVSGILFLFKYQQFEPDSIVFKQVFIVSCGIAGLLSLIAGTWHFLRSKES